MATLIKTGFDLRALTRAAIVMFAVLFMTAPSAFAIDSLEDVFSHPNIGGTGINAHAFGGAEFRYDDNVFRYSSDDIKDYDDGVNRTTKFKEVNSIADMVYDINAGFVVDKEIAEGLPTTFTFNSRFNTYGDNTRRNFQLYSFRLRQEVTENDALSFEYSYLPEFTTRELYNQDSRVYESSDFEKSTFEFEYWRKLSDPYRVRLLYRVEDREYNDAFDERNNLTHTFRPSFIMKNVIPGIDSAIFRYNLVVCDAEGNDGVGRTDDDDISFDGHGFDMLLYVPITEKFRVIPSYSIDFKEFTTSKSVIEDPLHYGRNDVIYRIGMRAEYVYNTNTKFFLEYKRSEGNPDTAIDPSLTSRDDDMLGFKSNVYIWGVKLSY